MPMKVFNGSIGGRANNCVAATSQKRASEIVGCSLYSFRLYWTETGNDAQIEAAMRRPEELMYGHRVEVWFTEKEHLAEANKNYPRWGHKTDA